MGTLQTAVESGMGAETLAGENDHGNAACESNSDVPTRRTARQPPAPQMARLRT